MTISRTMRTTASAAAFLIMAVAVANAASAGEKLVATYAEVRTILAFKVPDASAQKMLPEGWQVSPISAGPSKDANVTVSFIDWLSVQNPDGTPGEPLRLVALSISAKKQGTNTTAPMVAAGFASKSSYVPGPYGTLSLASATVDQHVHTDPAGKSNVEETWDFKADSGDLVQLHVEYVRGVATRSKIEATPYSPVRPDFYRIYRIEQAADVVRSTATGTDRAQKYSFKAIGGKFNQLFGGSEQLISITSLPWYSRQVFLPEQFTQ